MDTEKLCPGQSILKLSKSCDKQYQLDLLQQKDYFDEHDSSDFTFSTMAVQRQSSFFKQFGLLFHRNLVYTYRNPKSTKAFLIMTIIQCFLMCSIFEGVGNKRLNMDPTQISPDVIASNRQIMRDYLGFNFYCASD